MPYDSLSFDSLIFQPLSSKIVEYRKTKNFLKLAQLTEDYALLLLDYNIQAKLLHKGEDITEISRSIHERIEWLKEDYY